MAPRRPFIPYRRDLKRRSQSLRRDPSPAERKLWFEFLRELPAKFTRQKPLGRYIADFYCASQRLVIEVDGDSHFDDEGARYDRARTASLEAEGIRVMRITNLEVMEQFEGCASEFTTRWRADCNITKTPPLAKLASPLIRGAKT